MRKRSKKFKLVAFDANGNEYASIYVQSTTFQGILSGFLNLCESIGNNTFDVIKRLDLVGGNHTLFVFADVRSLVDQRNKSLIIQNF